MVCDVNTFAAAGEAAERELAGAGIRHYTLVLPEKELVPDEQAVGKVMEAYEKGTDLILAVGSGTLNDLCKFVSFQLELPYMILATAAVHGRIRFRGSRAHSQSCKDDLSGACAGGGDR